MVGRRRLPRGASDSIYHQGVNGGGGELWVGLGVGRAQQLELEGKLEKRPRLLLKVICHQARKTNSGQVLPRTQGSFPQILLPAPAYRSKQLWAP